MAEYPKLRSDLISSPSSVDGSTVYTVKDPVGGNYFRLREPEHWLVHQFDGRSAPAELAERFNAKYGSNLSSEDVAQFVGVMDKLLFLDNSRSEQTIGRFSAGLHTGTSWLGRRQPATHATSSHRQPHRMWRRRTIGRPCLPRPWPGTAPAIAGRRNQAPGDTSVPRARPLVVFYVAPAGCQYVFLRFSADFPRFSRILPRLQPGCEWRPRSRAR